MATTITLSSSLTPKTLPPLSHLKPSTPISNHHFTPISSPWTSPHLSTARTQSGPLIRAAAVDADYSAKRSSSSEPRETILLPGCDYNHWLIVMEFPKDPAPTREQMIDTYLNTLASVLGSMEEAKKNMYAFSTTTYTGFQCTVDEATSEKFKGLPGVLWVLPDSYIDVKNKDYGGDKYVNGEIIPCTYPTYQPKQRNNSKYVRKRYERRRDGPPPEQRRPRQEAPTSDSASGQEFNVPEFEDYDPTPYGGGYDIAQTYGKPLPHSEEICYPRSSMDSNAPPLNGFSYGSIPSPYGKEEVVESAAKPRNGSKPTRANDKERQILGGNGHASHNGDDDYNTGAGYGSGYGNGVIEDRGYVGNGSYGDHGCENEKIVPQIPSGYGLEAMDFCESIFGYWPCLSRNGKAGNGCQQAADEESCSNKWKGTADYLFGSSYPYGERWDDGGNYRNALYGYERHYQQQPHHYRQVEYGEDSWVHKFNIF